ncbi:hypothetical protein MHU86_4061 [Fragilaria crotonensis]|nr:hypothetical protein MHU86_4061 [Fragilaria crotonensis]
MDAEEIQHDNDYLVITIDIVDCPMAEVPLTEVFDVLTMSILDNYHNVIRDSVIQQLEDTTWLSNDLLPILTDPGFGMYHARDRNSVISLRKPALQRLILQYLKDRLRPSCTVHVPVMIRFLLPDCAIPKPPGSSVASINVHKSRSRRSQARLALPNRHPRPTNTTVAMHSRRNEDNVPVFCAADVAAVTEPVAAAATFRGQPVDTRPTGGHRPPIDAGRFQPTLFRPATTSDSAATANRLPGYLACISAGGSLNRLVAKVMVGDATTVVIPPLDAACTPDTSCDPPVDCLRIDGTVVDSALVGVSPGQCRDQEHHTIAIHRPGRVSPLLDRLRYQPIDRGRSQVHSTRMAKGVAHPYRRCTDSSQGFNATVMFTFPFLVPSQRCWLCV